MTTTTTKKLEDCYEPGTPDHVRMGRILDAVRQFPKGAKAADVAPICYIEVGMATKRLSRLARKGLLRREQDRAVYHLE